MAIIKMRFQTPDTGEFVDGSVRLTLKRLKHAKPLVLGESAILTKGVDYDVPASGASIETMSTPYGWYYHIEGTAEQWKFHTNVYVPNDDTYELEELITLDPSAPFAGERPEPQWWSVVNQLTDLYAESVVGATERAESAASSAESYANDANSARVSAEVASANAQTFRNEIADIVDGAVADGFPLASADSAGLMSASNFSKLSATPNISVETSAGTRVRIGGITTFYDSGWRNVSGGLRNTMNLNYSFLRVRRTLHSLDFRGAVAFSGDTAATSGWVFNGNYLPTQWLPDVPTNVGREGVVFAGGTSRNTHFYRITWFGDIYYTHSITDQGRQIISPTVADPLIINFSIPTTRGVPTVLAGTGDATTGME